MGAYRVLVEIEFPGAQPLIKSIDFIRSSSVICRLERCCASGSCNVVETSMRFSDADLLHQTGEME